MGDLSWNPTTWTPSNLAEEAVEFVTGSEAAGDVAGLATAWITGDTLGIASQAGDLGQNVMAGAGKLLEGFGKAAQDAFKEFSNPGAINAPSQTGGTCPGYGAGEASGPNDVGTVGNDATQGTGYTSTSSGATNASQAAGDANDIDGILKGPGSLEDKIFALLMKLQRDKKKSVGDSMNTLADLSKKAGANPKDTAVAADKDTAYQNLQKEMGELSQMTQLTTGIMQNFKQMKDSVIQNIR